MKRDAELRVEIRRVWDERDSDYVAKKVRKQLRLEGILEARCTVTGHPNAATIEQLKSGHFR